MTRFEYDSLDSLGHVTRRDGSVVSVEYDENGNPDKKTQRFDRYEFDENDEELKKTTAEVTTKIDYTSLDNVERRTFISGDKTISTLFERDEMENIYCKTLPENNQIKYRFDERNLLVENTWAPETEDETSFQYTWSRDGLRTSRTNGKGETIRYHYDNSDGIEASQTKEERRRLNSMIQSGISHGSKFMNPKRSIPPLNFPMY